MVADDYRCWVHIASVERIQVVVEGGQHGVVADQGAVADDDASLVLELTAGVDENIPAQGDVETEIGVEGWEDPEG